jgi:hypothetical protein
MERIVPCAAVQQKKDRTIVHALRTTATMIVTLEYESAWTDEMLVGKHALVRFLNRIHQQPYLEPTKRRNHSHSQTTSEIVLYTHSLT